MNFFSANSQRGRNSSSDSDHTPAKKKIHSSLKHTTQKIPEMASDSSDSETTAIDISPSNEDRPNWAQNMIGEVEAIAKQQRIDYEIK
jgi:hypothetical protein